MRLASVQENSYRSNGDVGDYQGENDNLPPWPIQHPIRKPMEEQIKVWNCIQKGVPKEI